MKRTLIIALTLLAACGGENNETNNTMIGGTNNAATNTATNNTATNNTSTNNTATNNSAIADCGAVTLDGECSSATTVLYCDDELGLVEVECTETFGATATCIVVPDWGADCAVAAGASCEVYDEVVDDYYYPLCSGDAPACVWSAPETTACQTGFALSSCDEANFTESCQGDVFVYDCYAGQPSAVDCAGLGGGVCDATNGCVMPTGALCDDGLLVCAAGMTCTIPDGEVQGTCG